ncbi:GntR family transcriptional regulator [Pseudooceanicola nanhaiensis]|uniref:GntR family transcriptional regulator n=1 Tax=Pseudooceanicola nanhaiensis TaxID=375761 RepID=UPI001CD63236|nr:GntR family transcriptional regulator [Pseudooceanicola nanhaiensis]MCA0921919.1 GntR family transcriptional regulator [Pseudooceanicola nanhaiensis]
MKHGAAEPSLTDQAFDRTRSLILRSDLEPGAEISAAQLCERLGLGLAPIRAALARLEQHGLVSAQPRKGYIVAPLTLQSVRDVFEMRLLLEPAALRKAVGRVDFDVLEALNAACLQAGRDGTADGRMDYLVANREFHLYLVRLCGNALMTETLARVLDESTRVLHLGLSHQNRNRDDRNTHSALIDALRREDADAVEAVTREEVLTSRRLVMEAILSSEMFQNLRLEAQRG